MELLVMMVFPLPLGFFLKSRLVAYVAYIAIHAFVFTFQTASLVIEWAGGSEAAFGPFPVASTESVYGYAAVNLVIYVVGLALVELGHRLGARRRVRQGQQSSSVSLDPVH